MNSKLSILSRGYGKFSQVAPYLLHQEMLNRVNMEKLVKKFEMISKLWVGSNEPTPGMYKTTKEQRYAEECKKVAIAFAKYLVSYYYAPNEEMGFDAYNNTDKYLHAETGIKYNEAEVFNKFIEEYYGKQS